MNASDVELVRSAWAAFGRGDIAAAAAVLDPHVRWYGADDPDHEGACRNSAEATEFMKRSLADGMAAELLDIHDAGDRLVGVIQTHPPPEWEQPPDVHGEVITVRDGKVCEMVVYDTVEEALASAGLAAGT